MNKLKPSETKIYPQNKKLIDEEVQVIIDSIRFNNLTYLSAPKLQKLAQTCIAIQEKNIPGKFIEAGCALGGLCNPDLKIERHCSVIGHL